MAVVATKYFANNHERALTIMHGIRYLSRPFGFNRRLHALGSWRRLTFEMRGKLFAVGEAVSAKQHAGAHLPAGARPPLPKGAWQGILRLLGR